jgi:hypothetical protein
VSPQLLNVEVVARETGLHPEVVLRLTRLGFVDTHDGRFSVDTPARLARATRIRHDLGVGWSGALLACELLDRIDELEARLRAFKEQQWTSNG